CPFAARRPAAQAQRGAQSNGAFVPEQREAQEWRLRESCTLALAVAGVSSVIAAAETGEAGGGAGCDRANARRVASRRELASRAGRTRAALAGAAPARTLDVPRIGPFADSHCG